jgi:uncharacterized membrane protein (TIGR02234 family)
VVLVLGVLGAAAVAGAAALTWWSQSFADPLRGPVDLRAIGGAVSTLLVPVALAVLAGLVAALAVTGVVRRALGAVLLLGGVAVVVAAVAGLLDAGTALTGQLSRPADPLAPATRSPFGPLLAVLGGTAVAAAGLLVVLGWGARRMAARFERTGRREVRAAARRSEATDVTDATAAAGAAAAGGSGTGADVASDWWKLLDAGVDPTEPGTRESDAPEPDPAGSGPTAPADRPPVDRDLADRAPVDRTPVDRRVDRNHRP